MESRGTLWLLLPILALAGSLAVLVAEEQARADRRPRSESFQRLTGGLGFGPALDLSGCAWGFDPRLADSCDADREPIPGGRCFCPRCAGAILAYPSVPRGDDGRDP